MHDPSVEILSLRVLRERAHLEHTVPVASEPFTLCRRPSLLPLTPLCVFPDCLYACRCKGFRRRGAHRPLDDRNLLGEIRREALREKHKKQEGSLRFLGRVGV